MQKSVILLFGLPRSGTSWVGKIFDSHPDTLYRHEPDKGLRMAGVPSVFPLERLAERRERVELYLRRALSNRSPAVTGKLPEFAKSYRSPGRQLARTGLSYLTKALPATVANRVQVPDLVDVRHPGPRLVWKSIGAMGRAGAIARLLPDCKLILLLRHPCGQIASTLRGFAGGSMQGAPPSEHYDLFRMLVESDQGRAHGLTLKALRDMHPVERLAWRWVLLVEKALADTLGFPRLRVVRYEDVCRAPLEGARELFEFAGLDWQSQTETFIQRSTERERGGYFGLQKDPVRSASKWRQELDEGDVRRIFEVLQRSSAGRFYSEGSPPDGQLAVSVGSAYEGEALQRVGGVSPSA